MDPELESNTETAPDETVADAFAADPTETDLAAAARHDANVARLEHDIDLLETEAKHLGKSVARTLGPPVAAVVLLSLLSFIAGRRMRNRAAARRGRKSKNVYRL